MSSNVGKKNQYCCISCNRVIVTVDKNRGTTPFVIGCVFPDCDGEMRSGFYHEGFQKLTPKWEWFKPNDKELERITAEQAQELPPSWREGLIFANQAHRERGGLFLRRITK